MSRLPEPEGWLAQAAMDCLRDWREKWGPAPFFLTEPDIDGLAAWLEGLRKAWVETRESIEKAGIPVVIYPVQIGRQRRDSLRLREPPSITTLD